MAIHAPIPAPTGPAAGDGGASGLRPTEPRLHPVPAADARRAGADGARTPSGERRSSPTEDDTLPGLGELAAPPPVADALYALGHGLLGLGQTANAADVFRCLLLARPQDERGWLALAECHERSDQPRTALELYSAGSVAAEPSPRCLLGRARVLRALGRADEAAAAVALALELAEGAGEDELVALARNEERLS